MGEDNRKLTLSLQEVLLLIILARTDSLKWKCLDGFVSYIHYLFIIIFIILSIVHRSLSNIVSD